MCPLPRLTLLPVTWILVTNDDGPDTPALPALATAMGALGEVRVVVPHVERSWIGKAITRFGSIVVEQTERSGVPIRTTTGFPADCVQLAVHAMFDDGPPSLIVSGINVGINHGSAYLQTSGTVGACIEGAIAGVPGIALSAGSDSVPWPDWRPWALSPESTPMWERLADVSVPFAKAMLDTAPPGLVISVNLPDDATRVTPVRRTRVAAVGYDQLFQEISPGEFTHQFGGMLRGDDSLDGTDVGAGNDGVIAVTPVKGISTDEMPDTVAGAMGLP